MVDFHGDLGQEIRELKRRIRVLESASPLGYSSISEGALEIRSAEGLIVVGSARVDGTLSGSGTFSWTGGMNLQGDQNVTGPTTFTGQMTVNGPWTLVGAGSITGNVDLEGILSLLSDLLVKAGGRIVVEGGNPIVLEQSGGTAHILMGGSEIRGGDGGVGIYPGSGPSIISSSAGVRIAYLPTIDSASAGGAVPGTVWCNALGYFYRVT
ncbi:hypothetical protein WDU99_01865 [Microbacterium sp. Mu-80]|uniref:Uncharacterized protein n=1 Tax=Microbacterium bandirmense TaxID=3122050 RepID=A0ABU8L6W1_9MICO